MDFASALERAAAARAKVAAIENALRRSPGDNGLRITLLSAKRMADRAEEELDSVSESAQVDLCRYKVVQRTDLPFGAAKFAKSISAYQDLFTAIVDRFQTGVKSLAKYTEDIKNMSELNIAYTFPGSLGVLLSIGNDRDLFAHGKLDDVVSAFDNILALRSPGEVRGLASELGLNVIRNTYKWADHNWTAQYSLDIRWSQANLRKKGQYVSNNEFFKIKNSIGHTTDIQPEPIKVIGALVGFHALRKTFSIVPDESERTISGILDKDFPKGAKPTILKRYEASLSMRTEINYATEEEKKIYELVSLTELPS